ncbi:MAG: hypothetical protein EA401_12645 [Planctomycetota bacterium]|nr:MAG: hypothetical protein EA401_12645 [Planctomycetota bacterium]
MGYALILAVVVLVGSMIALAVLARRASTQAFVDGLDDFAQAPGPRRCELAAGVLRHLKRVDPPQRRQEIWDHIEMPLLEALPDCPPELKPILINRLDELYRSLKHRDYQRRIMTMRNSLVPPDTESA